MKRFRFRLEKIFILRMKEEEQALSVFKTALSKVNAVEQEMAALVASRKEIEEALFGEHKRTALDVQLILILQAGLERNVQEIMRTQHRLEEARKAADSEREKYRLAKLKREQLEKVEDRHRRRHEGMVRAEEMKGLDEVAAVRFLKNRPDEILGHERSGRA